MSGVCRTLVDDTTFEKDSCCDVGKDILGRNDDIKIYR